MVDIKLSANECALGPSPKAVKAYIKRSRELKRYPSNDDLSLIKVLAKKFKLNKDRISFLALDQIKFLNLSVKLF